MSAREINEILIKEFAYYGTPMNELQLKLWSQELSEFTPESIDQAIRSLRKDPKKTKPANPAQISDKIYNFPTAAEAFAMLPRNENDSVVWPEQIAVAWGEVRHLMAAGDFYAARLAFEAAYAREVQKAKDAKLRPKWSPSFGHDPRGRDDALREAVEKDRISAKAALSWSPSLALPAPTKYQKAMNAPDLKLLEAPKEEELSEEKKQENLKKIQDLLQTLGNKKIEAPKENL